MSDGRGVRGAAARARSPDAPLVPGPRQHKAEAGPRRAGLRKRGKKGMGKATRSEQRCVSTRDQQ